MVFDPFLLQMALTIAEASIREISLIDEVKGASDDARFERMSFRTYAHLQKLFERFFQISEFPVPSQVAPSTPETSVDGDNTNTQ